MPLTKSESARINGAKSRGPKTPEGKAISSQNATTHGNFAKAIVLSNESAEAFEYLTAEFFQRYQPRDEVEIALVEQIIAATWRLSRCWTIQTETMNIAIENDLDDDPENVTARSFQACIASSPALQMLHRFENSYERIIARATRNLINLRKNIPLPGDEPQERENEPKGPANEPMTKSPDASIHQNEPKPPSNESAPQPEMTVQSPDHPLTQSLNPVGPMTQ